MVPYDIHISTMISLMLYIWKVCSDSVSQVYYTKGTYNDGITLFGDTLSVHSVLNLKECSYLCQTHIECAAFHFSSAETDNCQLKNISTLDEPCSGSPPLDYNDFMQEVRALEY